MASRRPHRVIQGWVSSLWRVLSFVQPSGISWALLDSTLQLHGPTSLTTWVEWRLPGFDSIDRERMESLCFVIVSLQAEPNWLNKQFESMRAAATDISRERRDSS